MELFRERKEGAGGGGAALKVAALLDQSAAVGQSAESLLGVTEQVGVQAAIEPLLVMALHSPQRLPATAELLSAWADTALAAANVAAAPLTVAADLSAAIGGDALKLGRGAIGAALAAVRLTPFLLAKGARLAAKPPNDVRSMTAPLEAVLASYLQAAHDVLEPLARPVPKAARKLLQDRYDPGLLDRARYLVSSFGLTIPEAVNGIRLTLSGEKSAFTVLNVIVFSEYPDNSAESIRQWSKALAEVQLYEELGVEGWAEKYVRKCAIGGAAQGLEYRDSGQQDLASDRGQGAARRRTTSGPTVER